MDAKFFNKSKQKLSVDEYLLIASEYIFHRLLIEQIVLIRKHFMHTDECYLLDIKTTLACQTLP